MKGNEDEWKWKITQKLKIFYNSKILNIKPQNPKTQIPKTKKLKNEKVQSFDSKKNEVEWRWMKK